VTVPVSVGRVHIGATSEIAGNLSDRAAQTHHRAADRSSDATWGVTIKPWRGRGRNRVSAAKNAMLRAVTIRGPTSASFLAVFATDDRYRVPSGPDKPRRPALYARRWTERPIARGPAFRSWCWCTPIDPAAEEPETASDDKK
jgi:hypothetical protein